MLRTPSIPVPRPDWARLSPFPSRLLVPPAHGLEPLLDVLLFLTVASSAFVVIDVVYNVLMVLSTALFMLLGIRLDRANMPFIILLVVYNLGQGMVLQPYVDSQDAREFLVGTIFVAVTGVFFAMCLNENTRTRFEAIRWGAVVGAVVASFFGLLGYLGIVEFGTLHGGRVSGTFNDPNVYGSFAAAACVLLASDLLYTRRFVLLKLGALVFVLLVLFLSFSRGSWFNVALGLSLLFFLTLVTTQDSAMRARIFLAGVVGFAILAMALMVVLSIDEISQVFAERFVLQKDYDSGPGGRFGNQLRSIPDLLGRPFGHGPNRFSYYYPENPHNTYLMAFSTYGWLGGITFICFVITTVWVTLRAAMTRSPFQPIAIAAFAMLVPHLVQNFQIDTDRWRHLFMIYGLCWGSAAVTSRYQREYLAYAHDAYRRVAALGTPAPQPPASSPA